MWKNTLLMKDLEQKRTINLSQQVFYQREPINRIIILIKYVGILVNSYNNY